MPRPPPIVTGISPKEGPPGTRVTIRGENLGTTPQDLIGLTICGVDCVMSAEWISPKKIIARFGSGKGRGDVIVTTSSGGRGTCTVQFKGFVESVGLLKESAVWVDDLDLLNINSWGRKRPASPSQLLQDNPLGLSDEGLVKKFPEDTLQELFPDASGNLNLENFNAAWFLLENHNGANFEDLNRGLVHLKRKVSAQIEGELSFLKANIRSIMDQLDTLNGLSQAINKYKENGNYMTTDTLEEAIVRCKSEADSLFEDVLGRKDKADATRNALGVLQRFKFLFNLPCNIERNIQKGDYDVVINDFARAKSLFADTEVEVFKKVYQEVELRIANFRETLAARLKELPLTLEEQKRIVRYLVNLETPGDPAWDCITYQYNFIMASLSTCKEFHISQDMDNSETENVSYSSYIKHWSSYSVDSIHSRGYQWPASPPTKVSFAEELTETISKTFPDLWKLGQAYFKGDLNQKDTGVGKIQKTDATKQTAFKKMVLDAISLYSNLFRSAILPHTLTLPSVERKPLGVWSSSSAEEMGGWLPQCLRYLRNCYSNFINLDLPGDALQIIQKLIFHMRVHCMNIMFMQATEDVKNLHIHETWSIEVDDDHGGTTQLPVLYENIVIEILQMVKETVFQEGNREIKLFSDKSVNSQVIIHIQKLLQAFAETLDILAFTKESVIDSSENLNENIKDILSQDEKLMVVLSNCNYTAQNILPKLFEALQKNGYPNAKSIISFVTDTFHQFHDRVFEAYVELKSDPIVGAIEQNMYTGPFDWGNCVESNGVRAYIKEIMHAIIAVHAEVFSISPLFVMRIIVRLVEIITEELSRLFSCIQRFSINGRIQARIDLVALQEALTPYLNNTSNARLKEAFDSVPVINNPKDKKSVEENLNSFKSDMKIQLMCFRCSSNQA